MSKPDTHTPGPWRLDRDYDANEGHIGITSADGPREWRGLAQVVVDLEGDPYTEGEANAHLIAAAPDMAEALEMLLQYEPVREEFRPDNKGDNLFVMARTDWERARAALRKARGEA